MKLACLCRELTAKEELKDFRGEQKMIRQIILNDGHNDEMGVIAELEDRGA